MSRYRQIPCLIWNDDKFPYLKDDTKLVFFHLLTTPYSTPFGLYKASIGALADEMRWDRERYEYAIKDAIRHGIVEYDEKAYLIYLPDFLKYNYPTSPNQVKSWKKIFDELPNSPLKIKFLQGLKAMTDGITDGIAQAIKDAFALASLIQEQEQEQYTGTGTVNNTNITNVMFPRSDESDRPEAPAEDVPQEEKNLPAVKTEDEKVIAIPIQPSKKNGKKITEFWVTKKMVEEFQGLYPGIDILQELREIRGWNLANPKRRKTYNGVLRHINSWLAREQNRASRSPPSQREESPQEIALRLQKILDKEGNDGSI